MKHSLIIAMFMMICGVANGQQNRIFRSEVKPFNTRHDALAGKHNSDGKARAVAPYIDFAPKEFLVEGNVRSVGQIIDVPYPWIDGVCYLHLENVGGSYKIFIDDVFVGGSDDPVTPADYLLSPHIKDGRNAVVLEIAPSAHPQIEQGVEFAKRPLCEGSYFYAQNKRSVRDVMVALVPDSTRKFGVLELDVVMQNCFNFKESMTVGYDIYSPQGKLLEFNVFDLSVEGKSVDTLRFRPYIYGTNLNRWDPSSKALDQPLYDFMLFIRRDGSDKEYMPFKLGFGANELVEGKITRFDKPLTLNRHLYNAAADRATTLKEIRAIKKSGANTLCPDYPQPLWFYELCDKVGLYVIDKANINAEAMGRSRAIGGTPSNDPALAQEYLERVKAMYYRSRNFSCIVAYELGGEAGNGYNMYKAYQWLKSVEQRKAVIYGASEGEWNSDL